MADLGGRLSITEICGAFVRQLQPVTTRAAYLVTTALAMMVTECRAPRATVRVRMVNDALVRPAGMIRVVGTVAEVEASPGRGARPVPPSAAARPVSLSVGTAACRVTVPRLGWPPVTVAGCRVRPARMPATAVG